MGWLIALGVLTLLAILPLGVSAVYNADGPLVKLIAGPVRFTVYPQSKKEEKEKTEERPKQKEKKKPVSKEKKSGGSFKDFFPLIDLVLKFLDGFRRKLRVNRLEMKVTLAGDDPCDLAINYGKAWAALGNLMPHLERLFTIKKRALEVACDFTSEKTLIYARVELTITLGRLLSLSTVHGIRILRQYLKILKIRKGGANL